MTSVANPRAYLLIDSRDGFSPSGGFAREMALLLSRQKVPVELMLVQNGVLAARRGAAAPARGASFPDLAAAGVVVLADEFSLRERGIGAQQLAPGVAASPLDVVIDRLAAGWQVIWH